MIHALDRDELKRQVQGATPFPHCCIDAFLDPSFAESVAAAFPPYEDARRMGREFSTVNEKRKVQIMDAGAFAEPVADLNRELASPAFLDLMSYVFGIPNLVADDQLTGGGIHEMGSAGRLDVHVDFNFIEDRHLYRRLNILIYFNPGWKSEWGGALELWDREVQRCHHSFEPLFNRCVVFTTTDVSFHGVTALRCPEGRTRKSFAAYYYTREKPPYWTGEKHPTTFRGRPHEVIKSNVLMPLERAGRDVEQAIRRLKRGVKKIVG
jgi:hypothetical protein